MDGEDVSLVAATWVSGVPWGGIPGPDPADRDDLWRSPPRSIHRSSAASGKPRGPFGPAVAVPGSVVIPIGR